MPKGVGSNRSDIFVFDREMWAKRDREMNWEAFWASEGGKKVLRALQEVVVDDVADELA